MSAGNYGQGPWGGRGGGGRWLLPLVIGVALGALLFGGFFSMVASRFAFNGYDQRYSAQAPQMQQQMPQMQQQMPNQPQFNQRGYGPQSDQQFQRGYGPHMMGRGYNDRHFGGGWFHGFGPGKLILPLLLLGAGFWLLRGRQNRGGPGGPGAYSQNVPVTPANPTPDAPHQTPSDRPTTGDTQQI